MSNKARENKYLPESRLTFQSYYFLPRHIKDYHVARLGYLDTLAARRLRPGCFARPGTCGLTQGSAGLPCAAVRGTALAAASQGPPPGLTPAGRLMGR